MPDAHPVATPTDVVYQMRMMTLREPDGQRRRAASRGMGEDRKRADGRRARRLEDCLFHSILRSMRAWSQDAATRSGPFSVAKQRLDAFAQQYNLPTVDLQFSGAGGPWHRERRGEGGRAAAAHARGAPPARKLLAILRRELGRPGANVEGVQDLHDVVCALRTVRERGVDAGAHREDRKDQPAPGHPAAASRRAEHRRLREGLR